MEDLIYILIVDQVASFTGGIQTGIDPVKNGITTNYNNGIAEGFVNKLNVVKRTMYNKCGFGMLKKKMLSYYFE